MEVSPLLLEVPLVDPYPGYADDDDDDDDDDDVDYGHNMINMS